MNGTFTNSRKKYKKVIADNEFKKLKIEKFNIIEATKKNYNKECIFTLNEFKENENIIRLPCNHIYNDNEITNWLQKESNTCPICRYEFDYKEINNDEEVDNEEVDNEEVDNEEQDNEDEDNEERENLIIDENIPFLNREDNRSTSRRLNNMLFLNYPNNNANNNENNNANNNANNNSNNIDNELSMEYTNYEIMQQEFLINYYNRLRGII